MATVVTYAGDVRVNGALRATTIQIPDETIDDDAIAAAGLSATVLQHQYQPVYTQVSTVTAAADRKVVHVVHGVSGTIIGFSASAVTKMTAAGPDDRAVTVDLYKNGASILSAVITMNKSTLTANFLLLDGTLSSTTLAADDVLEVVVAISGSTGTQALGVFAKLVLREDAA